MSDANISVLVSHYLVGLYGAYLMMYDNSRSKQLPAKDDTLCSGDVFSFTVVSR